MTFEQSLATLKAQLAELGVREDEIPRVEMQIVDWVPATAFNFGTIESEVMQEEQLARFYSTYRMDYNELQ